MKIDRILLLVFTLGMTGTAGFAEEKITPPSDRPWLGPKADLNKDGKIGVEEAQKAEDVWKQAHRESRQEKREEMREVWKEQKEEWKENREDWQEKKEDWKEKRQEWKEEHPKIDKDNNPPGMAGGPGAGPDQNRRDKDNNPPGMKGGPGSNWENKPGPQGGPGASPNRKKK